MCLVRLIRQSLGGSKGQVNRYPEEARFPSLQGTMSSPLSLSM